MAQWRKKYHRVMAGAIILRYERFSRKLAVRLCTISENTVNFHIKSVVDKLGAKDRTHAVTIAIRAGLLPV